MTTASTEIPVTMKQNQPVPIAYQQEVFDRIETELTAVVSTFQTERAAQKREIEYFRQMVQQRDQLINQIQTDFEF